MEVPFYYSFKEFKENYETDLKKWLEVYTEGNEADFFREIGFYYYYFIKYIDDYDYTCFAIRDKNREVIKNDLSDFLIRFGNAYASFLGNIANGDKKEMEKLLSRDFKELLNTEKNAYSDIADVLNFDEDILKILTELMCNNEDGFDFDRIKFNNFTLAVPKIYDYIIKKRIELEEKENSNEVEPTADNFTPLTSTQVDKIGLYRMLGIIDFLKDNNPDMNNSDISRLIVELSSEEMKPESIRPHLTDNIESNKHPFFKSGKIQEYEDILRRYKAKPYKKD